MPQRGAFPRRTGPAVPGPMLFVRVPRPWAAIAWLLLFVAASVLFFGRNLAWLRPAWLLALAPDFYSHVSNFSLSYQVCAGVGYVWLMRGTGMKAVLWLGAVIAVANLAYEFFIPVLNTPDRLDAWYGLAGTALALLVSAAMDRWGLVPHPALGQAQALSGSVPEA